MYRLFIYQTTGTDAVATVLHTPSDFTLERWSKRINAPGGLVFSMHKFNEKATSENLRPFRRVRLYRKRQDGTDIYDPVWFGYIEATKEIGGFVEVICTGMLGLFTKRYTAANELFNGTGTTEAFDLLSSTNSGVEDTGIVSGTGGVSSTRSITLDSIQILRAWEQLAAAHEAEFEIDDTGAFNFVSLLGSDKSGVINLVFRREGTPGANIDDIELGEDAKSMANRIIGSSTAFVDAGNPATKNDTTSQSIYGVLVERKQFNEANALGTLQSMTQAYLTQRSNPIAATRISPTLATKRLDPSSGQRRIEGLQYGDIVPGDLVTITIVTENASQTTAKRIAELSVVVDQNLQERLQLTLSEPGVFLTAGYLDATEIDDVKRRIRELEAQV